MSRSATCKILTCAITVLMSASAAFSQTPELRVTSPTEKPRWSIDRIGESLYRATSNNHGTVFAVTPEGIILADPLNTDFAMWLKEQFKARFGVPVRYVVYSHYHWDHASGGGVFADTARFVGHANMLPALAMPPASTTLKQVVGQYEPVAALDKNGNGVVEASEAPANLQRFPGSSQSQFEGFDANKDGVLSGAEVVRGPVSFVRPPDITYTDSMEISLGGQRVRLAWAGDMNHSQDSSIISFPDDSLLFIVDYVSFRRLPNREMDYELGKFEQWMAAIRRAEELGKGFKYVATGHGPVGTWEDIRNWRVYFEKLRDQVAAGIAKGETLEQMQRNVSMEEYKNWDGFDWVDENVLGMYHFLSDKP